MAQMIGAIKGCELAPVSGIRLGYRVWPQLLGLQSRIWYVSPAIGIFMYDMVYGIILIPNSVVEAGFKLYCSLLEEVRVSVATKRQKVARSP